MKNLINIFKVNFLILIVIFTLFSFSKIEASEPTFDWTKQLVGSDASSYNWPGNDKSIIKDTNGNIYVIGDFQGTVDFDPGEGVANLTSAGEEDTYILKLDSSGNYLWVKSLQGTTYSYANSLSFDSNSNIYITGMFQGTADFDPGEGIANLTSAGSCDMYILKLDSSGNYLWVKSFGGTGDDHIYSISFDSNTDIYVTGMFQGTADFDPGEGVANLTSAGIEDIYILKLDSSGNYLYSKRIGGVGSDTSSSLFLDSNANMYITGRFNHTVDFDPGVETANLISDGGDDIYILKLDSSGNYIWAKRVGGSNVDRSSSFSFDTDNNIYMTGRFNDTVDFDPGEGIANLTSSGNNDIYILKLDSSGNYLYSKRIGGVDSDTSSSLFLDSNANIYVTGIFSGTVDFDPGEGIANLTSAGDNDIYILKLDYLGNYLWVGAVTSTGSDDYPYAIYVDTANNIFINGEIYGVADMDPGTGTYTLDASVSGDDSFILKLTQTKPVITLVGESNINIYKGETYTDQGATANDTTYGDLTGSIITVNNVNTEETGSYTITYNLTDQAGNHAIEVTRTVIVNNRPVSSGSSASLRYTNLISMGNIQAAEEVKKEFPNQIIPILTPVTTPTSAPTELITSISNINKTIKLNTKGPDVKSIQEYLNEVLKLNLKIDGFFGKLTKAAVIKFQLANGLKGDGIVGPKTREKMREISF